MRRRAWKPGWPAIEFQGVNESASSGGHHGAVMPTMTAIVPRSSLRTANSASCHGTCVTNLASHPARLS
ncbi:hypothetical protein RISK_000881 [Rhodopirellula islandica]|uniref:Uncharacterized protein n=1 Tax=Rhodopirellula islandica TaxID=595434 RepID=A0A0J1BKL9_RHOIS|nr:hypothetical protein RISK_000881 [Rhodopirellula islandica]